MKRILFACFNFLIVCVFSQEKTHTSNIEVSNFYGNIAEHSISISHLITSHPYGSIVSWNKQTYGYEDWEQYYGYPEYGGTFIFQDMRNGFLGKNIGLYGHYNFYFLKRNVMLRIGQGVAYNTNPYDKEDNQRNQVYGSRLLSSTFVMMNYKRENIIDRLGLQVGVSMIHYSNANVKAPNGSTNTMALNFGVNYNIESEKPTYQRTVSFEKYTEPIKLNLAFRSGVNESDVIGSGQHPFYVFSAYADKRLSKKSALQIGVDAFFSNFLIDFIRHRNIAYPSPKYDGTEDYRRVGAFWGTNFL